MLHLTGISPSACLILWLAPIARSPLWVMAAGGLAATGAELAMGAFYRFALGVRFWDYTGMPGSLGGLVCPAFSLCWTALALVWQLGIAWLASFGTYQLAAMVL